MAPKRNMVTNIQGLRWASLLVKNQMASPAGEAHLGQHVAEHEEHQQEGDGGVAEAAFKDIPRRHDLEDGQDRHAQQAGPVGADEVPHEHDADEDTDDLHAGLVQARGSGDELEQQDERKGDQQHHEF